MTTDRLRHRTTTASHHQHDSSSRHHPHQNGYHILGNEMAPSVSNGHTASTDSASDRHQQHQHQSAYDEEHGYDRKNSNYELSSLINRDGTVGATSAKPQQLRSSTAHQKQRHQAAADGDASAAAADADDTKNSADADERSRALLLKTAFWIACWYATSLATLFLNKIILSRPGASVHVLGICQMTTAAVLGGWTTLGGAACLGRAAGPPRGARFARDMAAVGGLRGLTVVLGLVALEHVPVSFVETIKATAPAFTVVFARLILQERTAAPVALALVPVVAGLVLCSAAELQFDAVGFAAAVANNCADCVQNVVSKRMLARVSPTQLQFYTSVAALALQTPFVVHDATALLRRWAAGDVAAEALSALPGNEDDNLGLEESTSLTKLLIMDAICYHLQSVSAYCTMSCMSPVSQSVANTLKRALLVWASVLYFGNPVTHSGIAGIVMVVFGVFLYNHVRRLYQS